MDWERVVDEIPGIDVSQVINVYQYGSRVYGTYTDNSDYDICIVVSDQCEVTDQNNTNEYLGVDINMYTHSQFIKVIQEHHVPAIEVIYSPPQTIMRCTFDYIPEFTLDLATLRTTVSKISNMCMGYAKILWIKENEYLKSKKNIIHGIRYTMFGIQLATNGEIHDYSCANELYYQIQQEEEQEWSFYQTKYVKGIGKDLHTNHFVPLLPEKKKVSSIDVDDLLIPKILIYSIVILFYNILLIL
eukprot:TRINITY_DN3385_c0_g2_i4.p1 TRINITY_DN3385_c0_g2~~TRINITY_DN3385_c0_g2_i4.p1  ORF type:complete len:244 (+),score=42.80 TRINITY_DN3385_c0_g2_i4:17-748(+)